MKKAVCRLTPPRGPDPGRSCHPQYISKNGYGNGGEYENKTFPQDPLVEIGQKDADGQKGEDVPEPVAGFHDLKLGKSDINDIPFPIRTDIQPMKDIHRPDGRRELKRERNIPVNKTREGKHQEKEGQREFEDFDHLNPIKEPYKPDNKEKQGDPCRKELSTQFPNDKHKNGKGEKDDPAPVRFDLRTHKLLSLQPREITGNREDQNAVGIVLASEPLRGQSLKGRPKGVPQAKSNQNTR